VNDVARAPAVRVPLVAGGRLPLAFIILGLVAFGVAAASLAAEPGLLLLPHVHPHVLALVHLWLPGFLLSIGIGALYQLMPVVVGTPLTFPASGAWLHFGLHSIGVALLVCGFATGRFSVVATGGILVSAGVLLLLWATWGTFLRSPRRDAVAWSFPLAVTWLAGTTLSGVVFALNRRAPFIPVSVLALLRAHAHVGLAGFFVTLLQGATFQLIPMFTLADLKRPRWIRAGLGLGQLGLLVLTAGHAVDHYPLTLSGALLLTIGLGATGAALAATLRSRRRRVLEPGLKAFVGGAVLAGIAAGVGLTLVLTRDTHPPALTTLYGVWVIGGALTGMLLGMVCKIVPFLVWMRAYGPRAGRHPVPLATALGSHLLENIWLGSHATALATIGAALWLDSPGLLSLATGLFAAGGAALLGSIGRTLRHLWPAPLASATVTARVT